MSVKINEMYNSYKADYAEQLKAEHGMPKEIQKDQNKVKVADKTFEPHDEYISGRQSETKPSGLYRVGEDENGNQKVFFDDPQKSDNSGKPAEKCTANTDKVEREIRKLKEKEQELKQQIQSNCGNEKKVKELEKKLKQIESELSQKDNDTYRRQHTQFY